MQHTPEQLDVLWNALKSADEALRSQVVQRYASPHMDGAVPLIQCDRDEAQILAIPTPDHPGWHVYVRRPGGQWSQEH